jgi:hypothetical protein
MVTMPHLTKRGELDGILKIPFGRTAIVATLSWHTTKAFCHP